MREVHNVNVRRVGDRTEVSLHLKLPGELSLDAAHAIANRVEAAIAEALPEVDAVQTHLEPVAQPSAATAPRPADVGPELEQVRQIVRDVTGDDARELRLLRGDEGFVVFLTLRVDPASPLAEAHARASAVEARIREAQPEVVDVIVHTEP